jgi:cell division protein ZipA
MELVSLIIMILGLVALVGIYAVSRVSRRDLPQKRDTNVPVLKGKDGEEFSSILDDQPARDGKRPSANARNMSDVMMGNSPSNRDDAAPAVVLPPQLVLFVAADIEEGFAGEEVLKALDNAGLSFGDMGIFHRMVLTTQGERSLFSVANGVRPWTLVPDELVTESTPGLSLILNLPAPVADRDAIEDFMRTAERVTGDLNGVMKNQQQQVLTPAMRASLLALAG